MKILRLFAKLLSIAKFILLLGAIFAFTSLFSKYSEDPVYLLPYRNIDLGIYWTLQSPEMEEEMNAMLNTDGMVEFRKIEPMVKDTFGHRIGVYIFSVILIVGFYLLLHFSSKLILQIVEGNIFDSKNQFYLKGISILVILYAVLTPVISQLLTEYLRSTQSYEHLILRSNPGSNVYALTLGALISALSYAFSIGIKMREENEMTI